jgi:hypothetical protein
MPLDYQAIPVDLATDSDLCGQWTHHWPWLRLSGDPFIQDAVVGG